MTPQEALNVIRQACSSIQANLATHEQVQLALSIVGRVIDVPPKPSEPVPAKPLGEEN
jgi:hypothetical protein